MKTIEIDPKMFISPPYIECPNCRKPDCFGVLMVTGQSYRRRCKECWHSEAYTLPPLDKKVVYLDQFVISEMMKAVNAKLGKQKKVDPFYLQLFERLDTLCKLQILVCPDSEFHDNESQLSKYPAELKQMYEHLSGGLTFYDSATVRRFELCEPFMKKHRPDLKDRRTTIDSLVHGERNKWQDRLRISVGHSILPDELDRMRHQRAALGASINALFPMWAGDKQTFIHHYEAERSTYGKSVFSKYANIITQLQNPSLTEAEQLDLILGSAMSEEHVLIMGLTHYLPAEMHEGKKYDLVFEYLHSEEIKEVPFVKIMAAVFASLAEEVANGRKKPATDGMGSDVYMVSSLLPYCDAIFVDSEMHRLLTSRGAQSVLPEYQGKVFSLANKQDFLAYLDNTLEQVPESHKELVKAVYGESWTKPFYEMYSYNN